MLYIIKRDLLLHSVMFVITALGPVLGLLMDGLDSSTIMMVSFVMYATVLVSVYGNEIYHSKIKSYEFLNTLPVPKTGIAAGKFLVPFVFVVLYVIFGFIIVHSAPASDSFIILSKIYIIVNAAVCLLVSAFMFISIFHFGLKGVLKFVFLFFPYIGIIPALVKIRFRTQIYSTDWSFVIRFTDNLVWLLFIVIIITGYWLLAILAARSLEAREYD